MGKSIIKDLRVIDDELNDDGEWIAHKLIDENGDFDFSGLEYDGLPYLDNADLVKNTIEEIVEFYKFKVNTFILTTDYGEGFSSMEKHVLFGKKPIQNVINYFKSKHILHRLVWRSNGMNPQFVSPVKFEPISFWLGRNIDNAFDIGERKLDYKFLSLYRGFKPIRERFHNFLQDEGILENTLFSYNSEYEEADHWTNDYMVSLDDKSVTAPMLMKPGPYFLNTFCSIVYEALWHEKVVFPTEKLNKCLMVGHPFIIVSTPRYLANIKKIGFKTFSDWWDESYDDITDNELRFNKLKEVVIEVNTWSIEKCNEVYKEMIPTLLHNQELLKKLSNFQIANTYNILDIEVDKYNPPAI